MHRRTTVLLSALGLAAGLLTFTGSADARTVSPGSDIDRVPDSIVSALQRDLGLTRQQVAVRLGVEKVAPTVQKDMTRALGTSYGGTWISKDHIVVATTDRSQFARIQAAGATPRLVSYSSRSLDSAKSKLDKARAPRGITAWYVDPVTNKLVLIAKPGSAAAAKAFAARAGLGAKALQLQVSNESPKPLYDVRGGDAYYTGQYRCSIGFSVTGGYVSAGHCGNTGGSVSGFNQVAQGSFRGSSFPGNDYSWVGINSNWTARPWVNNYQGGNVNVVGAVPAGVGSQVCRSGSTTQVHCGSIQQLNASVTYPEGTVSGLIRTNVCAEGGDSGGSLYTPAGQAQGITSGGSGNCSSGGTTYFQPVTEPLQVYGLTLTTTGDNPPPTTCENLGETYTGSLATGGSAIQPNGNYWQSTAGGTFRGCLDGPTGSDFDLYLRKWNGSAWADVATSDSPNPDESITYNGTAGYYYWRLVSYSGSGSYTFKMNRP